MHSKIKVAMLNLYQMKIGGGEGRGGGERGWRGEGVEGRGLKSNLKSKIKIKSKN